MKRSLLLAAPVLLAVLALLTKQGCSNGYEAAESVHLPDPDATFNTYSPGASVDKLVEAVDEGVKSPGHGARQWHFVVIRAGDRHGAHFRNESFHAVIGAGVRLPEGALVVRRNWAVAGQVDGNNEQPQRYGISLAVEPGAARPYSAAVQQAAAALCQALSRRLPIHPDGIMAMGEIAYSNPSSADLDERALAKAARAGIPIPPTDGKLVIDTGKKQIPVVFETRDTTEKIEVGMMFRHRFDGENRGMLFVYKHPTTRQFWMKNCRIPIDLAYILNGEIQQIETMESEYGKDQASMRHYGSRSVVKYALEMEAGWFQRNGVQVGATVKFP